MSEHGSAMPAVPVPQAGKPLIFRNYVVAFFDILGQRENLTQMGSLPTTAGDRERFEKRAEKTVGAIHAMRSVFNAYFANYIPADPPAFVRVLPPQERKRVLQASEIEISFQGFSDTLIVFMPLTNRHDVYQWRGLHSLFAACATLMPALLGEGIALRGAVELDVGVEFVQGEIYGPVLQKAYDLESTVAGYPRIVVGDALRAHVERYIPDKKDAEAKGIGGETYDRHFKWLGLDSDAVPIVDYLGLSARQMLGEYAVDRVKDAYGFVCREVERFEREGNDKLSSRYAMAKIYYESRCNEFLR